jgi:hypothetical protein
MANSPLLQILWVIAALIVGAVMAAAWTGPHRSVSNQSRWAVRLRIRRVPDWLVRRSADRFVFRSGLVALVLLLAAAWLVPPPPPPPPPQAPSDAGKAAVTPVPPDNARAGRHIDTDLKNAIVVHVPKAKQIRIVLLKDDAEADQFAWEIDAFLRAEGYTVLPRRFFTMAPGGTVPSGTSVYPDEKDANVIVIRVGLNDRS